MLSPDSDGIIEPKYRTPKISIADNIGSVNIEYRYVGDSPKEDQHNAETSSICSLRSRIGETTPKTTH